MELDSNDPTVHHANGMVMVWLREYERAGVHFDRAVALNPADAQIRADRANWLRYAGRPEEALASIDDALKRTPVSTTLVLDNSRRNFVGTEEIWRSRSGLGQHAKKGSPRLAHTGGRP